MIRKITVPTLAALDYAAYASNPIRFDHQKHKPKKPKEKPKRDPKKPHVSTARLIADRKK